MTSSYRPQFLWILVGPLIGACVGATVATTILLPLILLDGGPPAGAGELLAGAAGALVLGLVFGGVSGAMVGFLAGLPVVFLVGRHLPRPVARRRAFVSGVVLSPVAMVAALSLVSGDVSWVVPAALHRGGDWWVLLLFLVASLLGGTLAACAARWDELPRPDIS